MEIAQYVQLALMLIGYVCLRKTLEHFVPWLAARAAWKRGQQ